MPNVTIPQLLQTPVVTRAVSTLLTPQSRIQKEFGVLSNPETGEPGPNIRQIEGQDFRIDVFDSTKLLATVRPKDTGPATQQPQVVGQIPATCIRSHDKMYMSDNRLSRIKVIGGQYGELDANGTRYLTKQQSFAAQKLRNLREFTMGMMLRGKMYFKQSGDQFLPTATSTGAIATVDFKIPAGQIVAIGGAHADNLTIGSVANIILAAAPWSTPATDIITDLLEIDQGAEQVNGRPFTHYWCNSPTWGAIINNTSVRNTGGSVNTPFESWDQWNVNGQRRTGGTAVLRGYPDAIWHICNEQLIDPGTGLAVDMFPTGYIAAHPDVDPSWFEMVEGSEQVRETKVDEPVTKTGIAAWTEPQTQPSGFELLTLDNFFPTINVNTAIIFFRAY